MSTAQNRTAPNRLVLAITDPGLRSVLSAQLSMAGELPISTADHLDPTLGKDIRATALLIIEEAMIGSIPGEWAETLRNQCWSGQVIIIVDNPAGAQQKDSKIAIVGRRDAGVAILTLVRLWQMQQRGRLSPLG